MYREMNGKGGIPGAEMDEVGSSPTAGNRWVLSSIPPVKDDANSGQGTPPLHPPNATQTKQESGPSSANVILSHSPNEFPFASAQSHMAETWIIQAYAGVAPL
ncbi:hypothetical protein ONZ45_g12988 [Pleurotus djamor]|nr:hypothetical protein ONZ45_g12988 [Pleurotus djamor]